jgi:hypothetical protein
MLWKFSYAATGLLACCLSSWGCGNSCEDLQSVCFYCDDPNQKASCEASVDRADQSRCDLDVTNYCGVCGRRGSAVVEVCK